MKHLVINLTKKCIRLYTEELKYIVERNRRNGKDGLCTWIRKLNIVKISFSPPTDL